MSEAEQAQDSTAPATPAASSASGGKGLGGIAAILSLAAIGAAGYVWLEVQKLQNLPQQLQSDAGKTERLRTDLDQQLAALNARLELQDQVSSNLQGAVTAEVAAAADLALQVEQLDERVSAMSGTDRDQRMRFLKAEALYYLRVANARALLASDAQVAAEALQLADDKLRESGDPQLTAVRAKISEELTALRAIPPVDLPGTAFKLQALAGQVASWPLRNPAPASFMGEQPSIAETGAGGEQDAWSRFEATVAGVFKSIVRVRENTERPEVQLSNTQHALVIESVRAELQLARLAFVNSEFALYEQALLRIDEQIRAYFDLSNRAVMAALETVDELAGFERPAAMPDISGSLGLLLDSGRAQ